MQRAQTKVEARNYDTRKNLLKFDDVMNDQRKVIYEQRIELMEATDVSETTVAMREEVVDELVDRHIPPKAYAHEWDTESLAKEMFRIFGLHLPVVEWAKEEGIADEEIKERIRKAADELMHAKDVQYGELFKIAQKRVLLQALDQLWKEHLHTLDHLRHGINLRAYGQRDPLNEYKQEAFALFQNMLHLLREQVTERAAHLEITVEPPIGWENAVKPRRMVETRQEPAIVAQQGGPPRPATPAMNPANFPIPPSTGRNDPCPCGSGKKFKHCHGKL